MKNQKVKNVAFTCSISLLAASQAGKPSERKKTDQSANVAEQEKIRPVCNFQSMKNPLERNSLFLNSLVVSPGLIRRDTVGLANEVFTSNHIVSSKQ